MGNAAVSSCGGTAAQARSMESEIEYRADAAGVYLSVYDLDEDWLQANHIFRDLLHIGGAFHAGIEVHGREWTYGQEGISCAKPRYHEVHIYRDSLFMGITRCSELEVKNLIEQELAQDWQGSDYDLLRRNCCSFADVLCRKLVGEGLPAWVSRFPKVASAASRQFDKVLDLDFGGSVSTSSAGFSDAASRADSVDSSEGTGTTVASMPSLSRSVSEDSSASARLDELSVAEGPAPGDAEGSPSLPTSGRPCPRAFIVPIGREQLPQRPYSAEELPAVHSSHRRVGCTLRVQDPQPSAAVCEALQDRPLPPDDEESDDEQASGWACL